MLNTRFALSPQLGIAFRGFIALAVAMGIGRFAFTPQLPLMQADLGLTLAAGGWLASANYLGYLIGALVAGRNGVPAALLMPWGLLVVVVSTAAMATPGPMPWWLVMRFLAGVASAWVLVGTAAIVLARLAEFKGRKYDGLAFAGVGTGIALAGLLCHIGVLSGLHASTLWLALAALALIGTLIVLVGEPPAAVTPANTVTLAPPDKHGAWRLRQLVISYGLFGVGYILPATYLPSQARALLQDPALFGWVWPIFGAAAAVSTLSIALLARWPRPRAWAVAQFIMAIGVLLPTVMPGRLGLALAALCVGGTFVVITLLGLQEVRQRAGPNAREWLAALTAAFALGQLSGPLIANALLGMGWPFNTALWMAAGALLVGSALLVVGPTAYRMDAVDS